MTEPYLLEMRGVSKGFPGVQAVADMHLTLRGGEVLALVGENGAGKSTLMKLLSGIHTPDEGEFFLDGQPVSVTGPRHAQELGISIIHQEFNLMPDLTVAQNIFIGREPRTGGFLLGERALNARAQELIDRLHLPLQPTPGGGPADGGQAADGGDRQGAVVRRPDPDHGRADRGAQRRRGAGAARDHPPVPPAGDRGHLHLAPDGRAQGHRRPDHGHPGRALHRHPGHRGHVDERGHRAHGGPRDQRGRRPGGRARRTATPC